MRCPGETRSRGSDGKEYRNIVVISQRRGGRGEGVCAGSALIIWDIFYCEPEERGHPASLYVFETVRVPADGRHFSRGRNHIISILK